MAKSVLLLLLIVHGAALVHVNSDDSKLRVQSNSSARIIFSPVIWNITNFMLNEVEMVKTVPGDGAGVVGVDKLWYVILTLFLGCCGVDRCFMGQCCLGCVKGFTLGGLGIWHLIDALVCYYSAFTRAEELHTMGYHTIFRKDTIEPAFWAAILIFVVSSLQNYSSIAQAQVQQKNQADLAIALAQLNNAQQQPQEAENKATEQQQEREDVATKLAEPEPLNIPTSHQSFAYLPTAFTRNLRKAGVVNEKPTIPELIAAFDAMDVNKDGQLDHEEIKEGMKAMGVSDEIVDEMIKAADKDGDGKINKNEFLIAHHKQMQAWVPEN